MEREVSALCLGSDWEGSRREADIQASFYGENSPEEEAIEGRDLAAVFH